MMQRATFSLLTLVWISLLSGVALAREQQPLFDGKTLQGWTTLDGQPITAGWEVVDGMIRLDPSKGRVGAIITTRDYGDFKLSFEWKIASGGNSGLKYRVRKHGDRWYGCEYQILDDVIHRQGASPLHSTGALYALYEPSKSKRVQPAGEFNTSRIVVQRNKIEHWLNGQRILSATVGNREWQERVAASKFSDLENFGQNRHGRIMLTDHGSEVWFRNFQLELLDDDSGHAPDVASEIQTILKVDKEGAGHDAAVAALNSLSQQPARTLVPLLRAMDQANPLAENWLRGAFEAIAARSLRSGAPPPKTELEEFALDRTHAPQSRKLAFDWLARIDPSAPERMIPGMVDDPSHEFRRLGAQRLIDAAKQAAEANDMAKHKELYLQAFNVALDPDQLDLAFDELSKLGEKPDLKKRLGLLSDWWLIGPFDHRGGIGFDAVYPPENEVDLQKKYMGQVGEVSWIKKGSDQQHATLDLNKLIGRHKGAVAYAYCEFESDRPQSIELRLGTPNGWKLWVNGELIFAHEEYHLMSLMDQYRAHAILKPGKNTILLKLCQNEQTEDWAQEWNFQIRACDSSGTAVLPIEANPTDSAGAAH
jgi:hypothetical protein